MYRNFSWMSVFYFVATIFLAVEGNVDENAIKCPLVWKRLSFGDNFPDDSLPTATHGKDHYIARAENSNEGYSGGRWKSGVVYIANGDTVESYQSNYGILTNPHGCIIDWQEKRYTGQNRVFVDKSSGNSYIGRAVVNNVLLSGEIRSDTLHLADESTQTRNTSNFQVLRSFSKGLTVKMTDFEFLGEDPFPPAKDFVGLDEIVNNGDNNLIQTVKFTKRVLESSTFKSAKSQKHTISLGVSVKAEVAGLGPELNLGLDFQWGSEENKEFSQETETTLEITREVIVPPFTSVQVCSTINAADNFDVNYIAKGVYTAPGLTPQEIMEVLLLDDKVGMLDSQNNVYVEESGAFSGSLTLTNQFIIVPYDSPDGCAELAAKIKTVKKHLQHGKYNRTLTTFYFKDLENTIFKMTQYNQKI